MTDAAARIEEIGIHCWRVAVLAETCLEDVRVAVRLEDGRLLAPTTSVADMERFLAARDELCDLLGV